MFKLQKRIKSDWKITITNSDFATTTITHDSNEDVPKAQHTTGDVEDFDVFLVVVKEDHAEILYDNNNLMMISISLPQKSLRQGFS